VTNSKIFGINWLETDSKVYSKAAETGFGLRRKGITIPATDLIITSCALIHDSTILHFDKHFEQIKKYYPLEIISFDL
jgi:predicted nucleic acid-binding protein